MTFPTPHRVGHHVHSDGMPDANNQAISVYTPPRDQPGIQVAVIGWETPKSAEPHTTGHVARVDLTVKLFVLPEFKPSPRDLIDIPGIGQCEVIGLPETAEGNPFGWNPGSTINLRRVMG